MTAKEIVKRLTGTVGADVNISKISADYADNSALFVTIELPEIIEQPAPTEAQESLPEEVITETMEKGDPGIFYHQDKAEPTNCEEVALPAATDQDKTEAVKEVLDEFKELINNDNLTYWGVGEDNKNHIYNKKVSMCEEHVTLVETKGIQVSLESVLSPLPSDCMNCVMVIRRNVFCAKPMSEEQLNQR